MFLFFFIEYKKKFGDKLCSLKLNVLLKIVMKVKTPTQKEKCPNLLLVFPKTFRMY